jgi:hypothetical protein
MPKSAPDEKTSVLEEGEKPAGLSAGRYHFAESIRLLNETFGEEKPAEQVMDESRIALDEVLRVESQRPMSIRMRNYLRGARSYFLEVRRNKKSSPEIIAEAEANLRELNEKEMDILSATKEFDALVASIDGVKPILEPYASHLEEVRLIIGVEKIEDMTRYLSELEKRIMDFVEAFRKNGANHLMESYDKYRESTVSQIEDILMRMYHGYEIFFGQDRRKGDSREVSAKMKDGKDSPIIRNEIEIQRISQFPSKPPGFPPTIRNQENVEGSREEFRMLGEISEMVEKRVDPKEIAEKMKDLAKTIILNLRRSFAGQALCYIGSREKDDGLKYRLLEKTSSAPHQLQTFIEITNTFLYKIDPMNQMRSLMLEGKAKQKEEKSPSGRYSIVF